MWHDAATGKGHVAAHQSHALTAAIDVATGLHAADQRPVLRIVHRHLVRVDRAATRPLTDAELMDWMNWMAGYHLTGFGTRLTQGHSTPVDLDAPPGYYILRLQQVAVATFLQETEAHDAGKTIEPVQTSVAKSTSRPAAQFMDAAGRRSRARALSPLRCADQVRRCHRS